MRRSQCENLSEDPSLKRWYENLQKGSPISAGVYRRRLGLFCKHNGVTPGQLLAFSVRDIEDKLQDYLSLLEKQKRAGSYIAEYKKAIRS